MKLLIVHLSDIHIRSEHNVILERQGNIAEAIRSLDFDIDLCVIVVSGDVAFSGKDYEYMIAFDLLVKLGDQVRAQMKNECLVNFVLVPGNHDCDFSAGGASRDLLLEGLLSKNDPSIDPDIMRVCTEVQAQFMVLRDTVCEVGLIPIDPLYWEYKFEVRNSHILFRCVNTAWASSLHEHVGGLFYPLDRLRNQNGETQLAITVFHHPYNWLAPTNARAFRKRVEELSDIVITGHEHDTTSRSQRVSSGEVNLYIEGGALQESRDRESSQFNVLLVDTLERRQRVFQFEWSESLYLPRDTEPDWQEFQVNALRSSDQFLLSDRTQEFLDDLGLTVSHPTHGQLSLNDIFVYPDVREVPYRLKDASRLLRGESISDLVASVGRILITGADKSGKTTLAKKLMADYRAGGFVPVFLDGHNSKFAGDERMYSECVRAFEEQYASPQGEEFRQLSGARRVIIVDNFHLVSLKRAAVGDVLSRLTEFADHVLLFAHDISHQVTSIIRDDLMTEGSLGFSEFRIQPFGHVRRNELAETWFALDSSASEDGTDLARRLVEAKTTMDTTIGNFVPPYPVILLSLLQALHHNEPVNTNASTYGYFYELLIRRSLAGGSSHQSLDVKLGYLTFMAGKMFEAGVVELSERELRAVHSEYEEHMLLDVPYRSLIESLVKSQILEEVDGAIRFKYRYSYYYFVALGLRDAISTDAARGAIRDLVATIHEEDSGNIMLFIAHLTKDTFVIEQMMRAAEQVFADVPPAELRPENSLMASVDEQLAAVVFIDTPGTRHKLLERLDHLQCATGEYEAPKIASQNVEVAGRGEIDTELAELNEYLRRVGAAFRTLQILGQLLKNFVGTMDGTTKRKLADECVLIGLRILGSIAASVQARGIDFVASLMEMLRSEDPNLSNEELSQKARRSIVGLLHVATYGVVKRISSAIGSPHLGQVYDLMREASDAPAMALVHTSIQLDQFEKFPELEIIELHWLFEQNKPADSVLRSLVMNHFHVIDEPFDTKQRVCAKLGIEYRRIIGGNPRAKLLKA